MHRNFWILSPNVLNNATEQEWKEVIAERKSAYIGYKPEEASGKIFNNDIHEGDVIIIAKGANKNKHCYLCGFVNSPAEYIAEKGTPGHAQRRTLIHSLDEGELSALELKFDGCAYGDAQRIPALYQLKPWQNENDQRIASTILPAINKKRIDELMDSLKLSAERQSQIKELWEKFKSGISEESKRTDAEEREALIHQWEQYRDKIIADTLSLDDYTNILSNETAAMPGGYLCNFLERTTRNVFGSSKPGTAINFGVKLNDDNSSYYIKTENKEAVSKEEAEAYFNEHIKGLLKSIVEEGDALAKSVKVKSANYSAKQILMKMAVLDNPKDFLYMYSNESIEKLHGEFIEGDFDFDMDDPLQLSHQVCMVAKKLLEVDDNAPDKLIQLSRFLWKYANSLIIADVDSPNVIMYGPPGTGKTYSVVNSLDFVSKGDSSCYEILQFHPSFSYEDFIDGIKPKGVSKDGNIRFELVNGAFKNFCIKAKNSPHKTFYFVVDEINRANLSAVFGETLSLLEKSYRHDGKSSKNLIKTQYSSLIEDLIKEDPTKIDLAYYIDHDNVEVKFGVPENLFFIGMMNDVDKSIDSFDLALRRRFKWVRKECDYDVIKDETLFREKEEFNNIDQYVRSCEELNRYISNDLGLGPSYEFGHSFFMKMSDISKTSRISQSNLETLFNLYLRPTLKEYLRAVFAETELDGKLNEALGRFKKTVE